MAPPFDALIKVVAEREAWRFRVRILRLWKVFNNSKLPSSIEMLLLDEFDGFFIVLATVDAIVEDVDWWYSACKCQRYRIELKVCDGTGTAVFVLFDHDSQTLFKTSCAQLLAECNKLGGGCQLPHVISNLVGQKMLFKVQTKSASSSQYDGSFCVRRAVFNPPFPNIINLGDDVPDVEIIPAKPFVAQMIVSPVPMGSDLSPAAGGAAGASPPLDFYLTMWSSSCWRCSCWREAGSVPMSSDSSFSGGKATLAKRKLYDTIEANRDVNACPRLKAVKIERD